MRFLSAKRNYRRLRREDFFLFFVVFLRRAVFRFFAVFLRRFGILLTSLHRIEIRKMKIENRNLLQVYNKNFSLAVFYARVMHRPTMTISFSTQHQLHSRCMKLKMLQRLQQSHARLLAEQKMPQQLFHQSLNLFGPKGATVCLVQS